MIRLRQYDLVYAASPYSKYPRRHDNSLTPGIDLAFKDVCGIMAKLIQAGVKAYSPIAHTHPIAIHGGLDPYDHSLWLPFDNAIMRKCDAILVIKMATWEESRGIGEEIVFFRNRHKPIHYLDPYLMTVTDEHHPNPPENIS